MSADDSEIISLLQINPLKRTVEDLTRLFQHLRSIEGLVGTGPSTHRDAALREICRIARLLRAKGDTMLYRKGDPTDCWYILLTGSVLIESSMFLPRNCFGTRLNASLYRQHDCFVLEESDLIVIDYIDREATISTPDARKTSASLANNGISENVHLPVVITSSIADQRTGPPMETASQQPPVIAPSQLTPTSPNPPRRKSSCSLDASGATAPLISPRFPRKNLSAGNSFLSTTNSPQQGVSSPASNSLGDSDDDFDASSHESLRDAFWEALLKEPPDRTVEDIETLVENVQKLPAFSNLSSATRYALCSIMLVAVVREAGQVVLSDGEVLDAWSVILNGTVEVADPDGTIRELTSGDSLGVRPSPETQYHRGQMITVTEDCQFVCVAQADYVEIMARVEGQAEIPEVGEGGRVVLVYENTDTSSLSQAHLPTGGGSKASAAATAGARIVVKGTPEKLIEHLMADMSPADSSYPEDFLLTYRTFLDSPLPITSRLLQWYHSDRALRSRVKRYVLLWVHNHFNDFEDRPAMLHFLNKFDDLLVKDGTAGERRLFHLACSTKAVSRDVEVALLLVPRGAPLPSSTTTTTARSPPGLATSALSVIFPFVLVGGTRDFGVFISQFDDTCKLPTSSVSLAGHQEGGIAGAQVCTNGAIVPLSTPTSPSISASTTTTATTSSSSSSSTTPGSGDSQRSFLPCCQLRRGDQIVAVNRRSVEGMSRSRVAKLIASLSAEASTTSLLVSLSNLIAPAAGGESADSGEATLAPGLTHKNPMGLVARLTLTVIYNPLHFFELMSNLPNPQCQSSLKATVVSTCGEQTSAFEAACFRDGLRTLATASPTRSQAVAYKSAAGDDIVDAPRSVLTRQAPSGAYRLQASPQRLIPLLNQELRSKELFANTSAGPIPSVAQSGFRASMRSERPFHAAAAAGSSDLVSARQALNLCAISSLGLIDLPTRAVGRPLAVGGKRCTPAAAAAAATAGLGAPSSSSGGAQTLSKSSSQPDLALALAAEAAQRQPHPQQYDLLLGPRAAGSNVSRRAVSLTAPLAADQNGGLAGSSPLQVIRVWRAGGDGGGREQSSKLVPIRKHTTALEAAHLAAEEFGVPEDDRESYCLCQVTVDEGPVIKQSRIGDQVDDLTSRTALNARYYLKHNKKSDALVSDDVAKSIYLESRVSFLQLSPETLSIQLTLDDYSVFRSVEATEYVDKVFNLNLPSAAENSRANAASSVCATASSATGSASSGYSSEPDSTSLGQEPVVSSTGFATGFANLDRFAEIVNKEAYWVPNEICAEQTLSKRVDSLKRFIKMAKLCRDLRNYNTMFCILVGLHMAPVERLRQTWERLPNKYVKLCRDLALVLDPSRNFFHYRNLLTAEGPHAPLIPYLPLVLKDLTFIHLGNPSRYADNLVNFAKLRMIAKEIRALRRMSTADYDLALAQRLIQISQSSGVRGVAAGVLSGLAGLAVDSGLGAGASKSAAGASTESPGKSGLQKKPRDSSANATSTATVAPSVNAGVSSTLIGAYTSGEKQRSTSPSLLTAGSESLPSTTASLWSGVMSQQLQNRRRSGSLSLKKVYDTWLMSLRVRTYLSNLNVSADLEVLSQMSVRIEPGPRNTAAEATTTTTAKTTPSSPQPQSASASSNPAQASDESKAGGKGDVGRTALDRAPSTTSASSSVCSDTKNTDTRTADSDSGRQPASAASSQLSPRRVPIFGAQSLEDTRRLLALTEHSHRRSHRMPQVLLPTNAPTSSQLAAEYAMAAAARLNGGCTLQQQQQQHPAHHHHHHHPPYPPMYQSHGLGMPGHQMQPCAGATSRDGLLPFQAAAMQRRSSISSCSSAALNNLSALVPTTARLPPSACHHSHCPHHGHPPQLQQQQQQQQMWSRQRACLRPSCSLDYSGSVSPPQPPPHLPQQQMMIGNVPPTANHPLSRGRAQSTRVPSQQQERQQQGAWFAGGGTGCPPRAQQQSSRPPAEGEVSGAQRPPGLNQPPDSCAAFQNSQQLIQNAQHFQNRSGKPQPPPYEHALALRQQQQQQQQKTSGPVSVAMKPQCPRPEPSCPKPPPHQMLSDSEQSRPATVVRSSSGHPPGAPLPQQYVPTSATGSYIQAGSPYARQQAPVQRLTRPPLPSYNQALAMKQQQIPPSAFAAMGGTNDGPGSSHVVPSANSGIPSRDLRPS